MGIPHNGHHGRPSRSSSTGGSSDRISSSSGRKDSGLFSRGLAAEEADAAAVEAVPLLDDAAVLDLKAALSPSGRAASGQAGGSSPGEGRTPVGEQPSAQLHMASLTTGQMLCTLDFWLLFLQFMIASGVCLAYLNNLVRSPCWNCCG